MADRTRADVRFPHCFGTGRSLPEGRPTHLWNETVGELRRRGAGYDLAYFFDLAVPSYDRREHLSTEDDLVKVDIACIGVSQLSKNAHE
ncbi:hypothetical protein OH738_39680 [Streptomyces hirsutus]|uniref:hypothetical protein n=1 Tax=Streptomyces hirsutus TaxID=35620 RepID=UPI0038686265|nr:hypothetical protein OH738_39680 [Streptomyces hirsutus]